MHLGGDGFIGYRVCLESLTFAAPLLLRAGLLGAERAGEKVTWLLITLTVPFFAAGAFVQGETNAAGVDPWYHWAPLQLTAQYGAVPVLTGAVIGLAAVFVVWAILHVQRGRSLAGASDGADVLPDSVAGTVLGPGLAPA